MEKLTIEGIPQGLTLEGQPLELTLENGTLMMTAGEKTDLFIDPKDGTVTHNSPMLLFKPEGDFLLSAKVWVDFESTFDAGVLLLYENETSWAKLCFERSPQSLPMVVSVVTKGTSDDCNSVMLDGDEIYMRVARLGRAFAFHYSRDGEYWHMVRYFTLANPENMRVGFSVQSPRWEACTATFSGIEFKAEKLEDMRSGQ